MQYDIQLDNSPAAQILRLLQQHGTLAIKDMETSLGVTSTAVRQQLTTLVAEEFVHTKTVREKRGRPRAVYHLTDKGQALFAQGYEHLALVLLEEALQLEDPGVSRRLLQRVSARLGHQYAEVTHGDALGDRLQALVHRLEEHGIISQIDEEADVFVFTEYGCPYYGVARQHRAVCEVEIEALEFALGSEVTLCQSQLDGHHGCQFQIKK